jgi:hypothetical protein
MSRASTLAKAIGADGAIAVSGNTTLGDASTDTVTINAATASIPNGINFTNGNFGVGVTPNAWSSYKAIQVNTGAGVSSNGGNGSSFSHNYYYDGTNDKYITTGNAASRVFHFNGAIRFDLAPSGTAGNTVSFTQAMTLQASGGLSLGTTNDAGAGNINLANGKFIGWGGLDTLIYGDSASNFIYFRTNGAEKARIDSSGNLLVGTTSTSNPGGVTGTHSFKTSSSSKWAGAFENAASSSPWGVGVTYTGASPNGTSNAFFYGTDTGGDRFFLRSNGGLANYSANNANLSDERTKTDIVDAGSYLAKICAIPVRTFKYKDQTDDLLNLGVIAQEVEAVAPELVDASGFGETPEDGVPLKAIYQTDLQYALMKCIQEQQAIITSLTARIEALEA